MLTHALFTRLAPYALAWVLGGAVFAREPHQVKPKATYDEPGFQIHCCVLPDGAFLAYYVRPGRGPTLVLIPETHGDRTQYYEPTFLKNLDPNLQVVIVESRGQGRSWPPPAPGQRSIEQYASDALAVVGQLGLTHWYVAGHSLGGMIALEIAGRRPKGLRGVIALEGWVNSRALALAFPDRAPPTPDEQVAALRQREARYRSQRWSEEEFAGLMKIWTAWQGGEDIVATTSYPVLTVWGDRGHAHPDRKKLLLPDRPNIRVHWIHGSDHYVTDPPFAAEVAVTINHFIREIEGGSAHSRQP